jgi:hypothetical protein
VRWFYFWVAALFPLHFYEGFLFSFPRFIHIFLSKGSLQLKGQKLSFF